MKKQRVVVQCTPLPAQGVPKTMKSVHQRITGDIADDLESIEDVFTVPNEGTPTKAEERKSFDEDLEAGLLASTVKASTEGHRGKLSVCLK